MSEYTKSLASLNSTGNMQIGDLPDRGLGTGFQSGTGAHGVTIGVTIGLDETNSLGSISGDTGSDPTWGTRNHNVQDFQGGGEGPSFTGSFGSFSAASDAPGEENVNDQDAGDMEYANYA